MSELAKELEVLAQAASSALFDGTATPAGMESILRTGAEHQKPRADNWDQLDYAADAAFIHAVCSNLPAILAALRVPAPDVVEAQTLIREMGRKALTSPDSKTCCEIERMATEYLSALAASRPATDEVQAGFRAIEPKSEAHAAVLNDLALRIDDE